MANKLAAAGKSYFGERTFFRILRYPLSATSPWVPRFIALFTLVGFVMVLRPAFSKAVCPCQNPVQCSAYQHQTAGALFEYAKRHNGKLPPKLDDLLSSVSDPLAKLMKCPVSSTTYIFSANGMNLRSLPKDAILLYESPLNHKDSKTKSGFMFVSYANGSTISVLEPQAGKIIAELNAGFNPPRPEIID